MDQKSELFKSGTGVETAAMDAGLAAAFNARDAPNGDILRSICRDLAEIPSVVLKSGIRAGEEPIVRPNSVEVPKAGSHTRYRIDGEIARGGMGAILRGRDTDLGRDLAVKVLLESHRNKPAMVQRFIEEAQIGGQLQHPGIAPVYELGQFSDERPFFSMKLIKGQTLSVLLSERESAEDDRTKLLNIFEQVCQTMAYAHSRGVIHRDLKPSNIMVGAFGEVQVMDWGLAKVLGEGGVQDEKRAVDRQEHTSIIETIRSQGSDTTNQFGSQTQFGSVLGTPAYMSPEQALGEIDHVDERTDVFALGAILCEIVTGKPPYASDKAPEVFRMATRGKLEACMERLEQTQMDASLRQLARQCLALEPAERPRDAGVVADRLNQHLESVEQRLRQSELDGVEAETRVREERKRRKVIAAFATSVILLLLVLGGGWIWTERQRSELLEVEVQRKEKIKSELATASALANSDDESEVDLQLVARALEALKRAKQLMQEGKVDDILAAQVANLEASLQQQYADEKLRQELEDIWAFETSYYADHADEFRQIAESGRWQYVSDSVDFHEVQLVAIRAAGVYEAAEKYARAFQAWGLDPQQATHQDASQQISKLPAKIQQSVLVSLERWRLALKAPGLMKDWSRHQWSPLKPVELKSRGGDSFEVLDDDSILVSGSHPEEAYDLVFDTDLTTISALKLDALPHPSLPANGPGRGTNGAFAIQFDVDYAPRDRPEQRKRLRLESAVGDNASGWLSNHSVRSSGGRFFAEPNGEPSGVFRLADDLRSNNGFRIWIHLRSVIENDPRNLGRFRWEIKGDPTAAETAQFLDRIIRELEDDPFRIEVRRAVRADDLVSLLKLSRQPDPQQPSIVHAWVTELLRQSSLDRDLMTILERHPWEPIHVLESTSTKGSSITSEGKGQLKVAYSRTSDVLKVKFNTSKPITGIRIDVDNRYAGRIVEFELWELGDKNQRLRIENALANNRAQETRIQDCLDQDPQTYWRFYKNKANGAPTIGVFQCAIVDSREARLVSYELLLRVEHSSDSAALEEFKLTYTSDPFDLPKPPLESAVTYVQRLQKMNPGSYWANLTLAQLDVRTASPNHQLAARWASAARAIRPSSDEPTLALFWNAKSAIFHETNSLQNYLPDLLAGLNCVTGGEQEHVFFAAAQLSRDLHESGRKEEGRTILREVLQRAPEHARANRLLARQILFNADHMTSVELGRALRISKSLYEAEPDNYIAAWLLSLAQLRNGMIVDARKTCPLAVEGSIGANFARFLDAMITHAEGDPQRAKQIYEEALQKTPEIIGAVVFQDLRHQAAAYLGLDEAR